MTICQMRDCENEADRVMEISLDDEHPVRDAFGEFMEIVAVGSVPVHLCGEHPQLTNPSAVGFKVIRDEWNADQTARVIKEMELVEIGEGPVRGVNIPPDRGNQVLHG